MIIVILKNGKEIQIRGEDIFADLDFEGKRKEHLYISSVNKKKKGYKKLNAIFNFEDVIGAYEEVANG
jgi:hypothetical protein